MTTLVEAPVHRPQPQVDGSPAALPVDAGFVERHGVRTYYEVYGEGERTVLLLPVWPIFHSRIYKGQIPYLAHHYRVVVFDGRGGGMSDRPKRREDYAIDEIGRDALAVMDTTGTDSACMFGASRAGQWSVWLATEAPERVRALALCGPDYPVSSLRGLRTRLLLSPPLKRLAVRRLPAYPSWLKFNAQYMTADYQGFLRWFVGKANSDPHSTRLIESMTAYASETSGATAFASITAPSFRTRRELLARARAIRCPLLVIAGTADEITPHADAAVLAREAGGRLISIPGAGHIPFGRYPALINRELRRFFDGAWSADA
jgi:pimeloyl-ACP methyl ester carboxylesterase